METLEAVCVVGGETSVREENWQKEATDKYWVLTPKDDKITVNKGLCVSPVSCPFADKCTRKVIFSSKAKNGFSKAIIHTIRFPNEIPHQITGESRYNYY